MTITHAANSTHKAPVDALAVTPPDVLDAAARIMAAIAGDTQPINSLVLQGQLDIADSAVFLRALNLLEGQGKIALTDIIQGGKPAPKRGRLIACVAPSETAPPAPAKPIIPPPRSEQPDEAALKRLEETGRMMRLFDSQMPPDKRYFQFAPLPEVAPAASEVKNDPAPPAVEEPPVFKARPGTGALAVTPADPLQDVRDRIVDAISEMNAQKPIYKTAIFNKTGLDATADRAKLEAAFRQLLEKGVIKKGRMNPGGAWGYHFAEHINRWAAAVAKPKPAFTPQMVTGATYQDVHLAEFERAARALLKAAAELRAATVPDWSAIPADQRADWKDLTGNLSNVVGDLALVSTGWYRAVCTAPVPETAEA